MPPDNRDLISGEERKPQTSAESSLESSLNTLLGEVRAIRRDVEQMQNLLSRMAFDEAGWPMNQVEKQLAGQGRRVRASAEADLRQHSMAVNLLLTAAGLIIGAVVSAIFTSHHWFGT